MNYMEVHQTVYNIYHLGKHIKPDIEDDLLVIHQSSHYLVLYQAEVLPSHPSLKRYHPF